MKSISHNHQIENNSQRIKWENTQMSLKLKRAGNRIRCLKRVYPRSFQFHLASDKRNFEKPSFGELKLAYHHLSNRLTSTNLETCRTSAERRFLEIVQSKTDHKIEPSVWIGSHCVDLFAPYVRSHTKHPDKVMRGLVFEIDGDCHKWEQKGIKDERKSAQLKNLGIAATHIPNWDFNEKTVRFLVQRLKNFKFIHDHRERKRLWTKVFSFTLAVHLSDKEFFQIFKQQS